LERSYPPNLKIWTKLKGGRSRLQNTSGLRCVPLPRLCTKHMVKQRWRPGDPARVHRISAANHSEATKKEKGGSRTDPHHALNDLFDATKRHGASRRTARATAERVWTCGVFCAEWSGHRVWTIWTPWLIGLANVCHFWAIRVFLRIFFGFWNPRRIARLLTYAFALRHFASSISGITSEQEATAEIDENLRSRAPGRVRCFLVELYYNIWELVICT
jgi:hypothetical protein